MFFSLLTPHLSTSIASCIVQGWGNYLPMCSYRLQSGTLCAPLRVNSFVPGYFAHMFSVLSLLVYTCGYRALLLWPLSPLPPRPSQEENFGNLLHSSSLDSAHTVKPTRPTNCLLRNFAPYNLPLILLNTSPPAYCEH